MNERIPFPRMDPTPLSWCIAVVCLGGLGLALEALDAAVTKVEEVLR